MFGKVTDRKDSFSPQQSRLKSLFDKFNNIIGRSSDTLKRDPIEIAPKTMADDSFVTSTSTSDLMAMSPVNRSNVDLLNDEYSVDDLLTGAGYDSICDVTMKEVTHHDFIDASSLDFLVKCAESNNKPICLDHGKESLYVKFDPLYSRKDEKMLATHSVLDECDNGYETGSTVSKTTVNTDDMAKLSESSDSLAINQPRDKPTQIVLPAIKQDLNETNVQVTRSTPALVRSVSAIIQPTRVAIDRLINITDNSSPSPQQQSTHDRYHLDQLNHLQSLRIIIQKQDQEITHLRNENRHLKGSLQDHEHMLHKTQEEMNEKIQKTTQDLNSLVEKQAQLLQQLNDKSLSNRKMSTAMTEFENIISQLIEEKEKEKLQSHILHEQLVLERDEALKHLNSMESSFNDLLSKYEKAKSAVTESKEKEKDLLSRLSCYEEELKRYEDILTELKETSSQKIASANETIETVNKEYSREVTKLQAAVKKHELTISSLQDSLSQKIKEKEELSRLCDQLISSGQ